MTTELPRITTMPTLFCSLADTCAFENQARISRQSLSRAIAPRLWSPQVSGSGACNTHDLNGLVEYEVHKLIEAAQHASHRTVAVELDCAGRWRVDTAMTGER